jgi:hypothetical protein
LAQALRWKAALRARQQRQSPSSQRRRLRLALLRVARAPR